MFPTTADRRPEARDEGYVTRIDQERFRRGYGEAVNRVEEDVGERDNDLPSYREFYLCPLESATWNVHSVGTIYIATSVLSCSQVI